MIPEDIKNYYKLLRHSEQTELRAIIPDKEIKTFHFDSEEELLKICKELDGEYNLYLGINERSIDGTNKQNIKSVGVIPIDIDTREKPATDQDLMEANTVAARIVLDGKMQGFKEPGIVFSGNGFQLLFSIPKIEITNANRNEVENKIKEFERRIIEKYSTDRIKIDNVGDLPRIMRIPGTFNLKSKTTSKFINEKFEEDTLLKEYILNLEITEGNIAGGLTEELKEKIKGDSKIEELFNGNIKGFKSRSEAEISLVCRLVQIGLNKEQIFKIMSSCKINKWQTANIQYRETTYRKSIEIITREKLKSCDTPSLNDLYLVYKKWLYLEDTKRIDIVLATYLTKFLEGTPIWLILVGNSGDGKTEQVMAMEECQDIHILHNLTSKTLVSGNPKVFDLAPELNGKIVCIPDMAQILQLPPQEKGELWGQLRDLYDGYAGKCSGLGKRAKYKGLRITMVACSTPKIDGQILVHQDLGTRELIYRTEDTKDKITMMEFAMRNEEEELKMRKELKMITTNFLKDKNIIKKEITKEEETSLKNIAMFISTIRASAEIDSYSNELRNIVYPEKPTRIVKQLKRIYLSLMSLEENYKSERAFKIIWHLAKSCAFPIRVGIFEHFISDYINRDRKIKAFTTSQVANILRIGKKTSQRELNTLWNMEILNKEELDEGNRWQMTDYWEINKDNLFIKEYLKYIEGGSKFG